MNRLGNLLEVLDKWKGMCVYILGAGKDGKSACKFLLERGIHVVCFIDEDAHKWGKEYFGVKVEEPYRMELNENSVALLAIGAFSYFNDDEILNRAFIQQLYIPEEKLWLLDRSMFISRRLQEHLKECNVDATCDFLDFGMFRLPNYLKVNDTNLQRTFLEEAGDLILPTVFDDWSAIDEGPYVDDEFDISSRGGDTIIDCGANLGLFTAMCAARRHQVYAFEPIEQAAHWLDKIAKLYKNVSVYKCALSNFNGLAQMTNLTNLGQNKIVETASPMDTVPVQCVTLDSFVEKHKISQVDFIKADIEGAERYMLEGAQRILKEYAPRLAICTYHLDDDPIVLEELIKKANPAYRVEHRYKKLFAYVKE